MARDSLITAREVARYLNCSASTVRRLAAGGQIPHYRIGKLVRFRRAEVDSWLARARRGHPRDAEGTAEDLAQLSLFGDGAPQV